MDPKAAPAAVTVGNSFITVLSEMLMFVRELESRRQFDNEVVAWLKEVGLTEDFDTWRARKQEAP